MASYEPLTRGMQAALPYVDDFMPVHNLESLEQLAEHLAHHWTRRATVKSVRASRSLNGHESTKVSQPWN
jgi:hypothetical protein